MSGRKRRILTPEEQKLWEAVKTSAEPLHADQVKPATSELALTRPKKKTADVDLSALKNGRPAAQAFRPQPSRMEGPKPSIQMDEKTFRKMNRGKLKPEARIDLHGMTLDQAHPALNRFIFRAHDDGKRLVLVITGKGKEREDGGPIPTRRGLLRHNVPTWLNQAPLAPLILQVTQASPNYGGHGAYFVYLRRRR